MLDNLIHIDQEWLLAINGWHSEWADTLMWLISRPTTWIPLYAVLIGLLIWRTRSQRWWQILLTLVAIFAAVGLADYISSGIIKHLVCRLRPTHEPAIENLLHIVREYRGGLYGFVSSHAANTAALTGIYTWIYQRLSMKKSWGVAICLGLYCALNCYSRMYLGVHYPGDIIGGLLVGLVVAWVVYRLWLRWVDGGAVADPT